MQNENQINRPFLIISFSIILLIALSYLPNDSKLFDIPIKPVELFIDIQHDSLLYSQNNIYDLAFNKENNFDINNLFLNEENSDVTINNNDFMYFSTPVLQQFVKLSGNVNDLKNFFNALKNSKSSQVRIAYYGDSAIEGDLISGDIRERLQKDFGGMGVGFLTITSQDITFRATTKHSFSNDWKTVSILTANPEKLPIGISGFTSVPKNGSWVKYEATNKFNHTKGFTTVKVFYTDAKASSIKYSFNNGAEQTANLETGSGLKVLTLTSNSDAKSIKITATQDNQAAFFGVSLEKGNGVYVDNFPLRGNSGVSLRSITDNIFKDFGKMFKHDLVILQFGLNMVSTGESNMNWYENQMKKVIEYIKDVNPNVSILLLGVGDKSIKRGSNFITDPLVLTIIDAQKKIARDTKIAFWDILEAMGGRNSMDKWVNANPPLASKDYVHLTHEGSTKVAGLLTDAILDAFNSIK